MNRKYDPWVSLVALLLLGLILTLACSGCKHETEAAGRNDRPAVITEETEPETMAETRPAPRFKAQRVGVCVVITDNQTGVQYLYYGTGYGGGLCVLEPGED